MKKSFEYIHKNKTYVVNVVYKRNRRIYFRFKNNEFHISCPYLTRDRYIIEGLNKYADRLINFVNQEENKNNNLSNFLLGEYAPSLTEKEIKSKAKEVYLERLRHYEKIMNISKPYNLRIRNMTTRYGSNSSQTHSICLSLSLIHYSIDIIDSVVIHELVHDKIRNHSDKFYNELYIYCPDYDKLRKKLRKGEFK